MAVDAERHLGELPDEVGLPLRIARASGVERGAVEGKGHHGRHGRGEPGVEIGDVARLARLHEPVLQRGVAEAAFVQLRARRVEERIGRIAGGEGDREEPEGQEGETRRHSIT